MLQGRGYQERGRGRFGREPDLANGTLLPPNDSQPHNDLPRLRQVSKVKAGVLLVSWASGEAEPVVRTPPLQHLGHREAQQS